MSWLIAQAILPRPTLYVMVLELQTQYPSPTAMNVFSHTHTHTTQMNMRFVQVIFFENANIYPKMLFSAVLSYTYCDICLYFVVSTDYKYHA